MNVSTVSQFTILSLNRFQSYAVLTKKEFRYCSDLAVIGLKHWVLVHIDLSNIFFYKVLKWFCLDGTFRSLSP